MIENFEKTVSQMERIYQNVPGVVIRGRQRTVLHDGEVIYVCTRKNSRVDRMHFREDLFKIMATRSTCGYEAADGRRTRIIVPSYGKTP